jgi:nucleobase:cation symporter-1, NCS1 family
MIFVDLLPTPLEKRNWRSRNYAFFYVSLSMDNWTLGSGLIGVGLNWWQAIIVVFISQSIGAAASAMNTRCAESYHIGYPVVARSVFGMYGSYYAVVARAVLAAIYFATKGTYLQSWKSASYAINIDRPFSVYTGGAFVSNMLQAVFGSGYTNIPNHIPASIGYTTQEMLGFFLAWIVYVPVVFLRPYQLRWLFTLKMIIIIPTMVGLFIFCMVNTKADLALSKFAPGTGSSVGWLFMYGLNSGLGSHSTLVTNQPDFSRWSRNKWNSTWTLCFYPFAATLAAVFGILSTSAINNAWGVELWNQWDLLAAILERYPHSSARFAVFVCAACWALLTMGTNIASNLIAFGSDTSMLLPRYLDMRRGQILCLLLAWPIFPWKILATATTFTSFLSGYGLFMGGISGVMIVDYCIWTKGNVFLPFLYNPNNNTHYNFTHGWNIQAYMAYICGLALPFAGFCGKLGAPGVSEAATHLYDLGWLLSFFISMAVYSAICTFWRTQNQKAVTILGLGWEEKASSSDYDFAVYTTNTGAIIGEDLAEEKVIAVEEYVGKGGNAAEP